MYRLLLVIVILIIFKAVCNPVNTTEDINNKKTFTWDPKGYIIYCPCMGQFGNQADEFLGVLSFAKKLDRTLVLSPWRASITKYVVFDEWFKVFSLTEYHKVILADDFMKYLAPKHWPLGKRIGWCWKHSRSEETNCPMKDGKQRGPFWDGLGVDFDEFIIYHLTSDNQDIQEWREKYPGDKYPVMAFRSAPARFPVRAEDRHLQKYLQWSNSIDTEVNGYIDRTFQGEKFIGIHLRNGNDWKIACRQSEGMLSFMASPQCLSPGNKVTAKLCMPPQDEILTFLNNIIVSTRLRHIYVATDKYPMINEIEEHLQDLQVKVHRLNPKLPQIDLAVLGKSDYFIGNCVSSFTAFVKRERDANNKPSLFWGQNMTIHDEL